MNRGSEQAQLLLRKAAEDESLLDAARAIPAISDAIYGFHAQPAAEKLLKALLSALRVKFRHTHDLKVLMDWLADAGVSLPSRFDALKTLNVYAVAFRYGDPEFDAPLDRTATRQLRAFVESQIQTASP